MIKKLAVASVLSALPFAANAADLTGDYSYIQDSLAPAPAHVGPTVLLSAHGGYNWISGSVDGGEDDQFWLYGGWAGVNVPVMGASGFQVEVFGEGTTADTDDADNYAWAAGAGLHLFWRDPSRGLFGPMGGAFYSHANDDDGDHGWAWLAGLEGQAYLGMTTLYGQVGYTTYDDGLNPDFPRDTVFVRGIARHFLGENTKLEGEVGGAFGTFDDAPESDFYLVNWALEAEQAFGGAMPLSVFLRYEGIYAYQDSDGDDTLDTTVKVGLRGRFGGAGESLYFNDRHGVSLNLPDVGRWGGILNGPIE